MSYLFTLLECAIAGQEFRNRRLSVHQHRTKVNFYLFFNYSHVPPKPKTRPFRDGSFLLIIFFLFSRETTPSSELCGESDEMDSLARKTSAAKTPPKEEIEEFFAKAEKQEQKRFAEK